MMDGQSVPLAQRNMEAQRGPTKTTVHAAVYRLPCTWVTHPEEKGSLHPKPLTLDPSPLSSLHNVRTPGLFHVRLMWRFMLPKTVKLKRFHNGPVSCEVPARP